MRRPSSLSTLALLIALLSLEACKGGGGSAKDRRQARRQALQKANIAAQLRAGAGGGGGLGGNDTIPPAKVPGWIVRGSDFNTFWPCGKDGYYYMRALQPVNARIAQDYKFAARRPYTPMYGEIEVRYVNDSITVGDRRFSRYVIVTNYTPKARAEADCRSPGQKRLSDEMQALDGFKVDVLMR